MTVAVGVGVGVAYGRFVNACLQINTNRCYIIIIYAPLALFAVRMATRPSGKS